MNLPRAEARRKRMYWVTHDGDVVSETILYTVLKNGKEYSLDLNWGGLYFENYWHAWAYGLRLKHHEKDKASTGRT